MVFKSRFFRVFFPQVSFPSKRALVSFLLFLFPLSNLFGIMSVLKLHRGMQVNELILNRLNFSVGLHCHFGA